MHIIYHLSTSQSLKGNAIECIIVPSQCRYRLHIIPGNKIEVRGFPYSKTIWGVDISTVLSFSESFSGTKLIPTLSHHTGHLASCTCAVRPTPGNISAVVRPWKSMIVIYNFLLGQKRSIFRGFHSQFQGKFGIFLLETPPFPKDPCIFTYMKTIKINHSCR